MERITISLDDDLAGQFAELMAARGYRNRSEAVRDLIRRELETERLDQAAAPHCIAALTYIYNHHERDLASRLTEAQHHHHDLSLSTMHVHLDHDNCMETVILRGDTEAVRRFADSVIAQPGVRHGRLHAVPVDLDLDSHTHGKHAHGPHVHSRPRT